MEKISVAQARRPEAIGREVKLQGWIRTRRDSKGGFSFLELNDGSCWATSRSSPRPPAQLRERDQAALGRVPASPSRAGARPRPPRAGHRSAGHRGRVHGCADPEAYPLQKKQHTFEFLRTIAHLRPRTNTFGAIARVRNCVSRSIHDFFQEQGFLYVHTPIITASDCEGAGGHVPGDHDRPGQRRRKDDERQGRLHAGFFDRPAFLTVSGQLQAETFACAWARSTPSAPRSGPRTPTPPGTWPSSGWSSRRWRSTSSPTTWTWPSVPEADHRRRAANMPRRHAVLPGARSTRP